MHHPFDSQGMPGPRRHGRRAFSFPQAHDDFEEFDERPFPPKPPFPPGPFGPGMRPGPAFRGQFPAPPHEGGWGPGPGFGFGFGRGGRVSRAHGKSRGPGRGRARRGNVRAAVLLLLAEKPMHGYEIIQEITERSHGWWRPSPGSVYPTLQLLADEGLVTTDQDNQSGKRLYALTDSGREAAAKQDSTTPPWEQAADDVDPNDVALREALSTLMAAAWQLSSAGTPDLRAKAAKILVETRRQLYLLLADAGVEDTAPVEDAVPDDADDE